ncbi:MAG: hypothetical protein FD165_481 [Gammaproteobacteria bacterium]|nr:MAG: hypothetical protein FD165_481 [Gammaproteobacteria bacterium]TND02257.1 MAG: hypothetical protein FD120_2421 [Gammaproteobacteria bacterium]
MNTKKEFDDREIQLLQDRAGYRSDSQQYANYTARLEQLGRDRIRLSEESQRKERRRMFWYSKIIPLIALGISIYALVRG